jgi:hypothetical protein
MRALSSIPVLAFVLLIGTACDSPTGPGDGINSDKTRLTLVPSATTIVAGSQVQLHFTARDKNGLAATPTEITWATSDPRVATVTSDGLVIGHANGASQITALWGGVHGQSTVTVVNSIQSSMPCSTSGANEKVLATANDDQPAFLLKKACVTR